MQDAKLAVLNLQMNLVQPLDSFAMIYNIQFVVSSEYYESDLIDYESRQIYANT